MIHTKSIEYSYNQSILSSNSKIITMKSYSFIVKSTTFFGSFTSLLSDVWWQKTNKTKNCRQIWMGKKMFFRMKDVCLRPLRIISHSRTVDELEHKKNKFKITKAFSLPSSMINHCSYFISISWQCSSKNVKQIKCLHTKMVLIVFWLYTITNTPQSCNQV